MMGLSERTVLSSSGLPGKRSHSDASGASPSRSGVTKGVFATRTNLAEPDHHEPDTERFRNAASVARTRQPRSPERGSWTTKRIPIDWSVLSGPRISRRTLVSVALASGAISYARQFGGAAATLPAAPSTQRQAQSEPKQGGTLQLGFGISQIPNFDPAKVDLGIVAGEIVSNMYSRLVQFDPDFASPQANKLALITAAEAVVPSPSLPSPPA